MHRLLIVLLLILGWSPGVNANTCQAEDFTRRVSGESQCLLMRAYGSQTPKVLLVWLHGDLGAGGNADYHFPQAEASSIEFSEHTVLAVALVRPGYPDGSGESSSVAFLHSGRTDHHTEENLLQVGAAIERLKSHYKAERVIAIGHSGGASTIASLLGLRPGLIDGAVLVACPCDMAQWRQGRRAWGRSEDPMSLVPRIPRNSTVIALTGERDDNTLPDLAVKYAEALTARGIKASFRAVPGASHNGAFRAPEVGLAIKELLERR
jgi:pimeloyl-ACP methyl ester carboxylesterase